MCPPLMCRPGVIVPPAELIRVAGCPRSAPPRWAHGGPRVAELAGRRGPGRRRAMGPLGGWPGSVAGVQDQHRAGGYAQPGAGLGWSATGVGEQWVGGV